MSTDNRGMSTKELQALGEFMTEAGFDVWEQGLEKDGEVFDCLCLSIPDDDYGIDRTLQFTFLPLMEMNILGDVDCLQVLYELPIEVEPDRVGSVLNAANILNNALLGGYIGFIEGIFCYRYSCFMPRGKGIKPEDYFDHILFLVTTVVGFTELLKDVHSGDMDLEGLAEALVELQELGRDVRLSDDEYDETSISSI